ncbi:MAG: hypothetical protein ACLTLQ_07445 [[Clostridium] scindens]
MPPEMAGKLFELISAGNTGGST